MNDQLLSLKEEIMLQVNESLYQKGILTQEMYTQAKILIVNKYRSIPAGS